MIRGAVDDPLLTLDNSEMCAQVMQQIATDEETTRLVDGFPLPGCELEHTPVVDGDARSAAIAAASIVAKVVSDRVMRRLDALYPNYGFVSHVGYITPAHNDAVRSHGPSELHRRSFQARCYAVEAA